MEKVPLVSVIIPTYNRRNLLEEAIKSVLAEDFSDYEIIVVDDGSNDGTEEYVKSIFLPKSGQVDLQLRFFETKNKGAAAARNFGIKEARGEYLAFLDADDLWARDFLSTAMNYLKSHQDTFVVYADQQIGVNYVTETRSRFQKNPPQNKFTVPFFIDNSPIQISSAVIRKKVIEDVGGFNESLRIHEDVELWNRISEKYEFGYIEKVLGLYRLRSDNISGLTNNKQFVSEARKYLQIYLDRRKDRQLTEEEKMGFATAEEFINNIESQL
ncbi:MAG: glycosyltransferase [Candidatus Vogelbacteria bacterium]|nr:glycosyltransferase [Candidatus Vogelbacteria bacterium]